jgi:hypothetical protein
VYSPLPLPFALRNAVATGCRPDPLPWLPVPGLKGLARLPAKVYRDAWARCRSGLDPGLFTGLTQFGPVTDADPPAICA